MKLAIFSDMHFGFGKGSERFEEAFVNAEKCLEMALTEKADAIIIPGDLFNEHNPSIEVIQRAFGVLSIAGKGKSNTVVCETKRDNSKRNYSFHGIPIIAIAGTHEFRGKDSKTVIDLFDSAGFLLKLHASIAEISVGNEKVFIHGLSGVPEKHALDALNLWNPKPIPNAKNILILHQSIKEFLPFEDEMVATISLNDLPSGFDLIIDGHLHWTQLHELDGKKFLLCGSTISTQMKKLECMKKKGMYFFDSKDNSLSFCEIPNQRKMFYHKIEFKEAKLDAIRREVSEAIKEDLTQNDSTLIPLIRLKLVGSLSKGINESDVSIDELISDFQSKAIFSVSKNFFSEKFSSQIEQLRKMQEERKSISELGFELLEKNLAQTDFNNAFDLEKVFKLLGDGEIDEAVEMMENRKQA